MSLKNLRIKSKLLQSQVAKALGISQSTVSMWENGNSFPATKLLPRLAELYKCNISDLFAQKE